ncbi:hypothetical protein VSAK1_03339 [Vibrio mediterranei AK1]|nr:hypothetical protein VSAK1_03339 [Vibrio mediterranei AK1]
MLEQASSNQAVAIKFASDTSPYLNSRLSRVKTSVSPTSW